MADIIDKIGKYFAEQEKQLRQAYVQTAAAHAALPPTTYPRSSAHQPLPPRLQHPIEADTLPDRSSIKERQPPSLLRRRLSQQANESACGACADTTAESSSFRLPRPPAAAAPAAVPPLVLSPPPSQSVGRPGASLFTTEDAWSDANDDGFASWRSAQSSYGTNLPMRTQVDRSPANPEVDSSDDDEAGDGDQGGGASQPSSSNNNRPSSLSTNPRKLSLKRRGSLKKKRRSASSTKHLLTEPDPEQVKREKERKVAAALVLAQERAKRIQAEREQQMREKELANREEQRRVQEEMEKIEVIRLKSKQFALRLRPSSVPSTPGAPSGSLSSRSSRSSKFYADSAPHVNNNNITSDNSDLDDVDDINAKAALSDNPESSPTFLDNLERQLRDRMVLELRIREKSLASQQAQEQEWTRVRSQLDKHSARNEKKQQRVSNLEAAKQSLERELAKVQEQLQVSRTQRLELEETSRRERAQRQREAERQLRARVRTEEWNRMLEDERVRSEVAAEARERAGLRVVSRASSLKKKAFELKEELGQTRRNGRSSNNNEKEHELDELELFRARLSNGKPQFGLLFAPELAEFEEDGLLSGDTTWAKPVSPPQGLLQASVILTAADPHDETVAVEDSKEPSEPETDSSSTDHEQQPTEPREEPKFQWRVPPFEDRRLFDTLLLHEMLSASDSE